MTEKDYKDYEMLVKKLANDYKGRGVPFEDLVQQGWLGFMKAKKNYDARYKTKLSTYAYKYIKGEILELVAANRTIHIPRYRRLEFNKIKNIMRTGTKEDVINEMGITKEYLEDVLSDPNYVLELDREGLNGATMLDVIPDNQKSPDELYEQSYKEDRLQEILKEVLTEGQREVILLRFGFKDGKDNTFSEIGTKLGTSGEAARKTYLRAMERLQQPDIIEEVKNL